MTLSIGENRMKIRSVDFESIGDTHTHTHIHFYIYRFERTNYPRQLNSYG